MTGPQHYLHAEALIHEAAKDGKSPAGVTALLARAQVHATLALTEAHVAGAAVMRPEDRDEWDRATGRLERDR